MYLDQNDDVFAPDTIVASLFAPATGLSGCPSADIKKGQALPGYAHNGQLHGFVLAGIQPIEESAIYVPALTVSIGEVDSAANLTGWIDTGERGRRHLKGSNFAFCDGHIKWYLPESIGDIDATNDGTKPTFNPFQHIPE